MNKKTPTGTVNQFESNDEPQTAAGLLLGVLEIHD